MCHIFRTVRPKNFKAGVGIEDVDLHQRQAPWHPRLKIKVISSHHLYVSSLPLLHSENKMHKKRLFYTFTPWLWHSFYISNFWPTTDGRTTDDGWTTPTIEYLALKACQPAINQANSCHLIWYKSRTQSNDHCGNCKWPQLYTACTTYIRCGGYVRRVYYCDQYILTRLGLR